MERSIAQLIGSVAGVGVLLTLVVVFVFAVMWPLMVFSMMRSLKGIRAELATLNETLQHKLVTR